MPDMCVLKNVCVLVLSFLISSLSLLLFNCLFSVGNQSMFPIFWRKKKKKIAGIFFVLPCIESHQRVDLRTITLDVPPQEVFFFT